jgi:hypothetical protein
MNDYSDEEFDALSRAQAFHRDKDRVGVTPEFQEGISKVIADFPDPLDYTIQEMSNINYARAYLQVWHNIGMDLDRKDKSVTHEPVFANMLFFMGYLLGKEGTSLR